MTTHSTLTTRTATALITHPESDQPAAAEAPRLRFRSLASGSGGNALLVQWVHEAVQRSILVDCGLSERELHARLLANGCEPSSIDLVLLTHEHDDHLGCALSFASRNRIALGASLGTLLAAGLSTAQGGRALARGLRWKRLYPGHCLRLFGLEVEPVAVPHDAREPLQFVLHLGKGLPTASDRSGVSLGILTDLGHVSPAVLQRYRQLDALVIECNHHLPMLERCNYPASVKRRIAGNWGHLSNAQAASFLHRIKGDRLRVIVAAHLSRQNNHPDRVRESLAAAIGTQATERLVIADQVNGFDWQIVEGLSQAYTDHPPPQGQ